MSIRSWIVEKLGGITQEEFESRGGWEVVVKAVQENRENSEGIVTPESSMRMAAVFACARVLAEAVASVPLHHYERMDNGGRKKSDDLPIARVLNNPNPFQTGFEYIEVLMKHLVLWGNAYSQVEYDGSGKIVELWPLPPQNILQSKIEGERRLYQYQDYGGKITWLSSDIIWHLHGIGDGLNGYSPIGLMRKAVSLGLSAEEFGKKFFDNDARPGIVVEHPGSLSEKALKNMKDSWNEDHQGVSKSHRMRVLEEGMKLHEVGIPPKDAQFLEIRKFQTTEIARIFRVPPHMIADLERATFTNIEHQGIEFVKYSILPWAKRIESSIYKFLYLERERLSNYPEFLLAGLERGDITSRYTAYGTGKQWGWLSTNDIRRMENMEPVDGGDELYIPLNMMPVGQEADSSKLKADRKKTNDLDGTQGFEPTTSRTRTMQDETESRAIRSVNARHRLTGAYRRLMLDTAEKTIKREVQDVSGAITRYLKYRDSGEFLMWLDEFYLKHTEYMTRQFFPIFLSFAESIAAEAQDEVQNDQDLKERLERFVTTYTGNFASGQAGISLFRMKNALQEALNAGENPEESLNRELIHWQEARPGEIAMEQSTREAGAVAKFIYMASGILALRWMTMGDSCPYCKAMDGRLISISKNFLSPGEEFKPEGAEGPMTTTTYIGHPPLHGGCDCSIAAGSS
jgi:HK97 family phage portal protein